MTDKQKKQWEREANKVLARKRNGLQMCDLIGEDLDDMEMLRDQGVPLDLVEDMLDGGGK